MHVYHNSVAFTMKPKRPLVIDLLGDTSDEEEDVKILETKKKEGQNQS